MVDHEVGAMPPARATHAPHRARILGLGLSVGIAIASSGCQSREARDVDYSMANNLAPDATRSGALARQGLADGFLNAGEAAAMWNAYRVEGDAELARRKAESIRRWARPASGTSGSAQDRNGLDPKGAGPAPKEDAHPSSPGVSHV
jgi:hypothetical protein